MSAPALALVSVEETKKKPRISVAYYSPYYFAAAYAFIVAAVIRHHEPWADEAQAWLLARDASITNLWTHLLHYEGSPGLWQTLLHGLIRLGLTYSLYNFFSAALGFTAVILLLRGAPFPLYVRAVLPFTYYLCYQYSVIARSYALIAPLLFITALFYKQAVRRPLLFHALLCLIAGVSVHGVLMSACIWLSAYGPVIVRWRDLDSHTRRRLIFATAMYSAVVLAFVLCAWPAKDVAFAEERGRLTNFQFFSYVTKLTFGEAFTGDWRTSAVIIALSATFLWRGGGWFFFLLFSASLCVFGTVIYAAVWHFGLLFLAWLFAIWISTQKTRLTPEVSIAILAAAGFQCYWTVESVRYDWNSAYSGSAAAAEELKRHPAGSIYAIGYPTLALQPYFSSNIYVDYNGDAGPAYWDWSKRNPAIDASGLFLSTRRPDHVLVGYTKDVDKARWAAVLNMLGYSAVRHFAGAAFWRTHVLESQAYDLYDRSPLEDTKAVSALNFGDPSSTGQILTGLYDIEMNTWRWTAKKFLFVLKPPPDATQTGAKLRLHLYVSPAQIQALGPITLTADVNGVELPSQTFETAAAYCYSEHIPARVLGKDLVSVAFRLNKATNGNNTDRRELGVVVTSVDLNPE